MENWNQKQVQHWLIKMTRAENKEIKLLNKPQNNGKVLSEMNPEKLQSMGFKISKSLVLYEDIKNRK